jgi:hypothetical protein
MGRTNATYRNHLDNFIDGFSPFKQALREENKQYLDGLFEKASSYAHAGSYLNSTNPALPAMISMMLGLQKEIEHNKAEIQQIKEEMEEVEF